jgi:hypothetical protein
MLGEGPEGIIAPGTPVEVPTAGGRGTSWMNGPLGLPDLAGSALTSAATLGGTW